MTTFRPAATRNVVLVVIALLLLVAAGTYLTLYSSGEEPAPDDQFVDFHCTACDKPIRGRGRLRYSPLKGGALCQECREQDAEAPEISAAAAIDA